MAGDESDGGGKGKLILLVVLGILLLAIIGVGGYVGYAYMTQSGPFEVQGPTPEEIEAARRKREEQERLEQEEHFIGFNSSFTFNVMESGKSSKHIVQVEIFLVVQGAEHEELANKHLPLLQGHISQILGEQTYEDLAARTGKQRLKINLLESLRSLMVAQEQTPVIEQVLFTNFVMQ